MTAATGEIIGSSGKCIDVPSGQGGVQLQILTCQEGDPNQQWTVPGDGTVQALGKCMDVAGGTANGTPVEIDNCSGGANQQWQLDGSSELVNPSSGRCLSTVGPGTDDGDLLHIWDCLGYPNQLWTLPTSSATVTASPSSVEPGGTVTVSWSGVSDPTVTDWIGLYDDPAADDSAFQNWVYDSSCTQTAGGTPESSGSCEFTMPTTAGDFEFRLFANDVFTRLATSNTVTVTGGGGSTAPAGAARAGFTTLALDDEFSDPSFANTSDWLDCDNSDSTKVWHHPGWNVSDPVPCNIFQTIDPVTGDKVLDMQWKASYWEANNPSHNVLTMETTNFSADPDATTDFPNAYYEITYRTSLHTPNDQCKPQQAFWSWGTGQAQGTMGGPIEWDTVETYGACPTGEWQDSGVHNWWGYPNMRANAFIWTRDNLPSGFDQTQYHTYALRVTGDGTTQTEGCGYVDGVLIACQPGNPTAEEFLQRNFLLVQNNADASTNVPDNDMYIKSIRVWSCAAWQTEMCNGQVLTDAP